MKASLTLTLFPFSTLYHVQIMFTCYKVAHQFIGERLYLMLSHLHPLLVARDAYDVRSLLPARYGDLSVGGLLYLMQLGSLFAQHHTMMLLWHSNPGSVLHAKTTI